MCGLLFGATSFAVAASLAGYLPVSMTTLWLAAMIAFFVGLSILLEEAGYVDVQKAFVGKKPQTSVRITPKGRAAFAAYLEAIGKLVG